MIGKSARDITAEEAPAYILGYTVANDVSARATQMKSAMPSFSKGLDSSCPLGKFKDVFNGGFPNKNPPGPVLVSSEALTNPQSLSVKTIYNGKTMQDGSTSDMIFSVYELVSYLSQGTTLEPGTILLIGTPEGIGFFRSPRVFLGNGDEIHISIDGIGTLVNKIEYE